MGKFESNVCNAMRLARTEEELNDIYERACTKCSMRPERVHCSCFCCPVEEIYGDERERFPVRMNPVKVTVTVKVKGA